MTFFQPDNTILLCLFLVNCKEDIVRYKLVVLLGLVAMLLAGTVFVTGRAFLPANAAPAFTPTGIGNISPLIHQSKLLGVDHADRTLNMSVGLSLRNQDQLSTLLNNLYDPNSPSYHHYLSVAQFAQEFSPTAQEQQAVESYLTAQGFTVTQTYANRLLIDFRGSQSLAERVFGVTIKDYMSQQGRHFYANANTPMLPAYLASSVSYVGGLDNAAQYSHPPVPAKHLHHPTPAASSCPSASATGPYIPSQLATAYNYTGLYNAGLQGQGQTVGLFELDGYSASDIQTYAQCFGGGSVPLSNVVLDGFNGQPGQGAIEVELDIETIISMAPKLSKLVVYEAPNTTQGYNDEFARIVTNRTPVVSVSWGQCETASGQSEANQENQYFQEAAAQGQTILVAAGDSGSEGCFSQNYDFSLVADDPAAQPYVTGVGGTTLSINSNNGYNSETVWNDGFLGGAGGGGLSQYWKIPSWQKGPGVQSSYSNGMRETPDVSLNADPNTGYNVYCTVGSSCSSSGGLPGLGGSSGWITVGGTSAAAPMWASMIALTNQEAAQHGKSVIGFLNPSLYSLASGSHYGRDFHDIKPPSSSSSPSNNDELGIYSDYPVTNDYDMATGWGSFNAANLAADLVAAK
jgi:subtilase family serine protease